MPTRLAVAPLMIILGNFVIVAGIHRVVKL